ncbi:MAG TPA: ribonuclease III [Steroidobacteraceae bacterium]|nr:ribonuclease III [Steroidobacteraceae bacterium]
MRIAADWLDGRLGYRARDVGLIEAALTHRSAGGAHNERLEFLGDAVLNCLVAELLFRHYPNADEGELSRLRATLVSGEALAETASAIGLGDELRLGAGELRSGGFRRPSILADALEALIGAVYLDGGLEAARGIVERLIADRVAQLPDAADLKDPKTRLQEYLQARGMPLPVYTVEQIRGDAHLQTFEVRCDVATLNLSARGSELSRRRAEQQAAEDVLRQIEAGAVRAGDS